MFTYTGAYNTVHFMGNYFCVVNIYGNNWTPQYSRKEKNKRYPFFETFYFSHYKTFPAMSGVHIFTSKYLHIHISINVFLKWEMVLISGYCDFQLAVVFPSIPKFWSLGNCRDVKKSLFMCQSAFHISCFLLFST